MAYATGTLVRCVRYQTSIYLQDLCCLTWLVNLLNRTLQLQQIFSVTPV
ncbi:hypothetical protein [Trichormus variabilis]|nr:hypothetical protein [Trichormus variabilis]MBD2629421.1 hypothetical protein [Trichormus variabilis FACHB-164]